MLSNAKRKKKADAAKRIDNADVSITWGNNSRLLKPGDVLARGRTRYILTCPSENNPPFWSAINQRRTWRGTWEPDARHGDISRFLVYVLPDLLLFDGFEVVVKAGD